MANSNSNSNSNGHSNSHSNGGGGGGGGRGLHSSTFGPNLSAFSGVGVHSGVV